MHQKN